MDDVEIKKHLALAAEHIADAESRIRRQQEAIAKQFSGRRPTEFAEKHLAILTETLKTMEQRRKQLLSELNDEEVSAST